MKQQQPSHSCLVERFVPSSFHPSFIPCQAHARLIPNGGRLCAGKMHVSARIAKKSRPLTRLLWIELRGNVGEGYLRNGLGVARAVQPRAWRTTRISNTVPNPSGVGLGRKANVIPFQVDPRFLRCRRLQRLLWVAPTSIGSTALWILWN